MSFLYISGFICFFTLVDYQPVFNENAMKILNPERKAKLLDGFSNMRKYYLIPIVILMCAFFSDKLLLSAFTLSSFLNLFYSITSFYSYHRYYYIQKIKYF